MKTRKTYGDLKKSPKPFVFSVSGAIAELLLVTSFLLISLFVYEGYWTNIAAGKEQTAKDDQLVSMWQGYQNPRGTSTPALGEAFARIYIPSFGPDYSFAIVEGTTDADLLAGPGRYVTSQMPGESGNFAIAGHRVGKGSPFNDLGKLNVCDSIVIETRTQWLTYNVLPMDNDAAKRKESASPCLTPAVSEKISTGEYSSIMGRSITTPENVGVISPLPETDAPASPKLLPLLTLTTCHPQFSNAERMIVHGVLTKVEDKNTVKKPAAFEKG